MTRESFVRIGIDIPTSLHKELKLEALEKGKTLKAVVAEILEEAFTMGRKKKKP